MKKGFKKILALALAVTMVFSLAITASAETLASGYLAAGTIKGATATPSGGFLVLGSTPSNWDEITVTPVVVTLNTTQAADTSNAGDFVTAFDSTGTVDPGTVRVVFASADTVDTAGGIDDYLMSIFTGWGDRTAGTEYNNTDALSAGDFLIATVDDSNNTGFAIYAFQIAVSGSGSGGDTGDNSEEFEGTGKAKEDGDLEGKNELENLTIKAVVPMNLNFALNPLQIGNADDNDNQVTDIDFTFINRTEEVPLKISVDLSLTLDDSVELVADSTEVELDDDAVETKRIFFGAVGADVKIADSDDAEADDIEEGDILATYDPTTDALVSFEDDEESITIAFGLAKHDTTDVEANIAVFTFYAQLDTYADWEEDDIAVAGAYTLLGLRGATYAGYEGDDQAEPPRTSAYVNEGSSTQLKAAAAGENGGDPVVGFVLGDGISAHESEWASTAEMEVIMSVSAGPGAVVPFVFDGLSVESFAWYNNGNPVSLDGSYTVNASGFVVDFTGWPTTGGPHDIWIEMDNGDWYILWVNITA